MTDRLEDFFETSDAPDHDLSFRLTVMERVTKRRLIVEIAIKSLIFILISFGFAIAWPAINNAIEAVSPAAAKSAGFLCIGAMIVYGAVWIERHNSFPMLRR